MTKVSFIAADFANVTANYLALANKRDVAIDKADKALDDTRKAFYIAAAVAIMAKATLANGEVATVDSLQSYLIASVPLAMRQKALKAGKIKDVETLPACGETVRSQFYSFKVAVEAGHLQRIIDGEAINTVAREARKAKKAAPSNDNGKSKETPNATAPLAPVQLTNCEELAKALSDYRKGSNVKAWRDNQAALARMMADLTAMSRAVEAAIKAEKDAPVKAKRAPRKVAKAA